MYDKEQVPIFREPNRRLPLFIRRAGIFNQNKRIKEYFTGFLERNAMLRCIVCCFLRIPNKALTLV